MSQPGTRPVVAALSFSLCLSLVAPGSSRAELESPVEHRLFLRLAAGPAFAYESWQPTGGSPGATYTGWGPAVDVTVGRRLRPGLAIAGDLQLAGIINRSERYLGGSYALADTLHLVDTLGVLADYAPRSRPWFHFGGGLGAVAVTDVDTNMGGAQTSWGWSAAVHAGIERHLSARWSVGLLGRLTLYHFGGDAPPPPSSSTGLLPTLLVTFTRG